MEIKNIICAGVGGQGILFASKIISEAAFSFGFDVKNNEVHGMAQRGGSVICQVRYGEKVFSPLIQRGEADILIGLEKLETMRFGDYLKENGICLVSDLCIMPPSVSSGIAEYPTDIDALLRKYFKNLHIIPADKIAESAGNKKASNTVMLGALSHFLDFPEEIWMSVLAKILKGKHVDLNRKAFLEGRNYVCSGIKK